MSPTTMEELWPPFGLTVALGGLSLRAIRDVDLPELVEAAADGIHDAQARPFPRNWASTDPTALGQDLVRRYWKYRAMAEADEWTLPLIVRLDHRVVGVQGVEAVRYPVLRTPDTFSWLTRSMQGRGLGTLMRQAICALCFDELDAHEITSGAYADNPASAAVSRKVGYAFNGARRELRDDRAAEHHKFILQRANFVRAAEPVTITGAVALRSFLGVPRASDPQVDAGAP